MRISPLLAMNNTRMNSPTHKNQANMPVQATKQTCPKKAGAKKSNKIQLCQQTVQQLFLKHNPVIPHAKQKLHRPMQKALHPRNGKCQWK